MRRTGGDPSKLEEDDDDDNGDEDWSGEEASPKAWSSMARLGRFCMFGDREESLPVSVRVENSWQ